jgi:ferric iron reductase protein FhuF
VPLGARLLWGNVAASAATAFRTMEGCLGRFVEPLAPRFFALAPSELQGLGSFATVEHAGRRAWFWERTTCCLFDRLPDGIRCADCSRTPPSRRAEDYRASLESLPAPDGGRHTGR